MHWAIKSPTEHLLSFYEAGLRGQGGRKWADLLHRGRRKYTRWSCKNTRQEGHCVKVRRYTCGSFEVKHRSGSKFEKKNAAGSFDARWKEASARDREKWEVICGKGRSFW